MSPFWKRKSVLLVLSLVLTGLLICIAVRSSGKIRFSGRREWKAYLLLFGLSLMVFPPLFWQFSEQLNRYVLQPIATKTQWLPAFASQWLVPVFKTRPWLALIPLPFLLYALNPNLTFANDHHCDTWYYHGLFYWFDLHLYMIPGSYFSTRLPAIVPGFLLYSTLPAIPAHFVYHLLFYYSALFSIYSAMATLKNRTTGVIIALLFGTHTMIMGVASTDYIAFPIVTFLAMTIALFLKAKPDRRSGFVWIAASGACVACSIWTNLLSILCIPFCVLLGTWHYLRLTSGGYRIGPQLLKCGAGLLFGFILCTFVLSLCNVGIGNDSLLFFAPQINYARIHDGSVWAVQDFSYLKFSPYVWPAGICIGLLITSTMAGMRLGRKGLSEMVPQILLIAQMTGLILVEIFYSRSMFQYDYYVCYLIPSTLVVFGWLIHFENLRPSSLFSLLSLLIWVSILVLAVILPIGNTIYRSIRFADLLVPYMLVFIAVGMAASSKFRGSFAPLMLLGLSQMGLLPPQLGADPWLGLPASTGLVQYSQVDLGIRFILKENWKSRPVFWINEEEGSLNILGIRRSMIDNEYTNRKFPTLPDKPFEPGQHVVIMSKHLDVLERARRALQQHRLDLADPHSILIGKEPQAIEIVCATIVQSSEPPHTGMDAAYFLAWDASREALLLSEGDSQEAASDFSRAKFSLSDGAAVEVNGSRLRITTPDTRGSNQATAKLAVEESGDYKFRVHVHVLEGAFQMEIVHPYKGSLGNTWTPENGETRTVIEYQMYLKKGQVYTLAFGNIVRRNASTFDIERFDISKL